MKVVNALKYLLGGTVLTVPLAGSVSGADPVSGTPWSITDTIPNTAGPVRVNLNEVVHPDYREAVLKVVQKPTVSTRASAPDVVCTVQMYQWLFDHPDRVALAWQRLNVPAVPISDAGNGLFMWTDENGSEVVWRTVGTFAEGRVWYATGKVKPGPVTPSVPVKAVCILTHKQKAHQDGVAAFSTSVQMFVLSESKAANVMLKMLGPAAPKVAEQGAEQFLEFFNGMADYLQKNPTKAATLLAPKK